MIAFCQDKQRRDLVLQTPGLNGIDYLEVLGSAGCGTQLAITFLKDARTLSLAPQNIAIAGDTTPQVLGITGATASDPLTLTAQLAASGDFSPYTLTLVASPTNSDPPAGIDPQLATVTFSFKASCPSPADCETTTCCPASPATPPDIHYLARDYDGFRQALLDRMAALLPAWSETHVADPGITILETLAYAADRISYLQDAVNTEAYIGTARSRISLRRHARLVDYQVQEGANARAWVCLTATIDGVTVPAGTQIFPLVPGLAPSISSDSYSADILEASSGPVFESLANLVLHPEQNQMDFYTWGDGQCCLAAGTTQATLKGIFPSLAAGDVLVFEEVVGPLSGDPADADPTHRCAVRLTAATTVNQSGMLLQDPVTGTNLTNIAWQSADALLFPLCISSVTDAEHGSRPLAGVSVARGNVLPADQGTWTTNESLGVVPAAPPAPVAGAGCNCSPVSGLAADVPRFRPVLAKQPLTFAVPYSVTAAATAFLSPNVTTAAAQITLASNDGATWTPIEDLLDEGSEFTGFVPEIEFDGSAHLRFGDNTYGSAPATGVAFTATYRTGLGSSGNVGREALAHVLFNALGISGVRNPIAASGGTDPENMDHIRQVAPFSFESQLRCVTQDDYSTMASGLPGVAEAKGTIRWTGSWYTAFVSIEPTSLGPALPPALRSSVTTSLNTLRMMGTDVVAEAAQLVGIEIGLTICVGASYFQGDVYAAVWALLVTGDPCTGQLGILNAANFEFGETVYASPILAAVQAVTGVVSVTLTIFERMDSPTPPNTAAPNQLAMGSLEIPRCDNDPNHADRGLLVLTMDGGK